MAVSLLYVLINFFRPPRTIVWKALCFTTLSFYFIARSSRFLGRSPQNFAMWSEACSVYKCRSKSLGVCSPKKFGGKKHAKFGTISDPFPLWARIFPQQIEIVKRRRTKLSTAYPLALDGRRLVNFGPLSTAFSWLMFTHKIDFLEDHISTRKGCCAPKLLSAPQNGQVLLAHTPQRMGVPLTIFLKGVKIGL